MLIEAVRDGGQLVRWAEPNTIALNDERVEEAVLRCFSARPVDGDDHGVPMLRPCDPDRAAVPLLDAVRDYRPEFRPTCDRCGSTATQIKNEPDHRLWIPSGATVAELVVCWFCHDVLNDEYADLVWR